MKSLKDKIIEVRQITLHAECAAMANSNMDESIQFDRIGKKLDKIIQQIDTEEITKSVV